MLLGPAPGPGLPADSEPVAALELMAFSELMYPSELMFTSEELVATSEPEPTSARTGGRSSGLPTGLEQASGTFRTGLLGDASRSKDDQLVSWKHTKAEWCQPLCLTYAAKVYT